MRVLAADTSTPYCSVALCDYQESRTQVLCETLVFAGRRHSELLLTLTRDLLATSGHTLHDIDLLAISVGPGSFTGLRVGVATFKGLALGMGRPLAGVSALTAMARRIGAVELTVVCPMIDARMDEVFAAVHQVSNGVRSVLLPDTVAPVERILETLPHGAIVFGDGALRYRAEIESATGGFHLASPEFHHPTAVGVALEAGERYAAGSGGDASLVVPVYLRKSQAEIARKSSEVPVA